MSSAPPPGNDDDESLSLSSSPARPTPSSPSHLLEVTVISAQDLHRRRLACHRVRAYAVAWADARHKLRTGVDHAGGAVPTWNDRFLFRVGGAFLRSDTAAVTVEVRGAASLGLGADPVLGVTRIVVSTFVRLPAGGGGGGGGGGRGGGPQVAALQLRRPRSLRPQGIVNVAVALLDATSAPPLFGVPGGSPDAVAVKDLVMQCPAAAVSQCKAGEEAEAEPEPGGVDDGQGRQQARSNTELVGQSGHLDPRGAAVEVEQRKLELTLEKWKAELWPGLKEGRRSGRRKRRRAASCFRGTADWDRISSLLGGFTWIDHYLALSCSSMARFMDLRAFTLRTHDTQALRITHRAPAHARDELRQTARAEFEKYRHCDDKQNIRVLISEGKQTLKRS